jgi:putative MFS transporter
MSSGSGGGLEESQCSDISLDQVLSECGLGFFHKRLLVTCGFGFAAAAVEVVLTAFLFTELEARWGLNEYELGALPSLVGFGSTIGELVWGSVADSHGRRPVFMVTVVIVCVFGILSALSPTFWWLYLFRFMVGFGYGGNIAVDFAIFTELLPTEGRGDMLFYISAFWPIGQASTCLLAWAVIPSLGWRAFLVVCAIPTLITAFLRPLIPESPRWLLLKGREQEALEVCRHIAETNGLRPEDVGLGPGARLVLANEGQRLLPSPQDEEESSYVPSLARLWGKSLWRTTLACSLYVGGLGFAGYGATTFMPTFLEDKGLVGPSMYQTMTLNALSQFPGIAFAMWVTNRHGRRLPLQLALFSIAASLAVFAFAQNYVLIIMCTCLASCSLEFGWAMFHVYSPEVFPTELRATALGFISATGSVVSMAAPFTAAFLITEKSALHVIMFFSAICAVVSFTTGALFHQETMDQDLLDRASQISPRQGSLKEKGDAEEHRAC